ncbi:MAG TPA: hypothetical protein VIR16_08585 [Candidatus Limnocylindrales bacterium]
MGTLRRLIVALAWFVIAILVSLGGAGMASALNHAPATDSRPELTWSGDQQATAALDAAVARLQALSDAVDALGSSSRQALVSLVAGNTDALTATLATGTTQLSAVSAASDALKAALAAVPYTGPDAALHVSATTIARYQQLAATTGLTSSLASDWAVLSARAMAASVLPDLLAKHDLETAAAAKQGEAGHYQQAIALLDAPDATLAQAGTLRDSLAENADVTTLTAWIDRHAAYDAALRNLYKAMLASKGKVTKDLRAAFAAEEAAKAALPTDTRALVVIMGDIARGGLNQAVIDIEEVRGALSAALEAQPQGASGAPAGSASPSAGPGSSSAPPASVAPSASAAASASPSGAGSASPAASGKPGSSPPAGSAKPGSSGSATPSAPQATPPP